MLAHALQEAGVTLLTAIDTHPDRWHCFLETSGLAVMSPTQALHELPSETIILVCNPNHLADISEMVGGTFKIGLPSDLN